MRIKAALFSGFMMFFLVGCVRPQPALHHTLPTGCDIYDMRQAHCITDAELVRRLEPYRVLFAGDHHSMETMHLRLAALIEALGRSGRSISLANEWFIPDDNTVLAQYAHRDFDGNFTMAIGWEEKAGYPLASYAPIYDAVRAYNGALYGINMRSTLTRAISDANLSDMRDSDRRFIEGMDMNLSAHRDLLSPFFSHCHARREGESDQECAQRLYRVQVAWDSYMGKESAQLVQQVIQKKNDLLIVFAGSMHLAYGLGINARFARDSKEPFVTLQPVPEGTKRADVGEADYLLFYPGEEKK